MSIRCVAQFALATFMAVVGAGLQGPAHAGSMTYEILADTSGLVQGSGGLLDMNLGASYPPGSPSVSVSFYNPITDGIISPAPSASDPYTGTAAGDLLGAGVTMNNSQSTSEVGQDFVVKSFFDVFVDISGPEVGSGAVGPWSGTVIVFNIYDAAGTVESATFTVNPNVDPNGNPIVDGTILPMSSGSQVMIIPLSSVPEPSSVILLGLGLGAVVGGRRLVELRAA
jgi:hypothetical protein